MDNAPKSKKPLYVTQSFLPPLEEYQAYLTQIWQNNQLTNQGPLLKTFEQEVTNYLGVQNFQLVANGTLALQLALRALDITEGEVITTPFSYVATTSAILWEHCQPVFVDVEPDTLCIDPTKIEAAITENTKAILAVHVFGNPCDVEAIEAVAVKHNLKVIYDGAHAFGVTYRGKSLLSYGDISICSFHATKLFHTIEGGCLVTSDAALNTKIDLLKRFGHNQDTHLQLGINAKASELQAAMGLCNLKYIDEIIAKRQKLIEYYNTQLGTLLERPRLRPETGYNQSYYPVLFKDETTLLNIMQRLEAAQIFPRRYFYPALNKLPYLSEHPSYPIAENVASRILCLPLSAALTTEEIDEVVDIIRQGLA